MKISLYTINALSLIIMGNKLESGVTISPYRSGPMLVDFFNQFGFNNSYENWLSPSRLDFTTECINKLNGKPIMKDVIVSALDSRVFLRTEYSQTDAIEFMNSYLLQDGFKIHLIGNTIKLTSLSKTIIQTNGLLENVHLQNDGYIQEQIDKCNIKISDGDLDGAITNARSLVESMLVGIESILTGQSEPYGGNLNKLYKRVSKSLNLSSSREDINDSIHQILGGLTSIVNGISSLRNLSSDAHVRSYKPSQHHAELMVNASKTLTIFLLESYWYQISRKEEAPPES